MTLTQLSYILALGQHRHFGAAAEACYVTQPTLSMQIQKLEEELGAEIFDRAKQPIEPTSLGRLILDQARVAMAEVEKIQEIVRNTKETIEGPFRLGVIPTLAPSILPLFISKFTTKYPKLEVTIEELQTHQIVERLKTGEIDVGLLVTPLGNSSIVEHPLFQEPFLLYLSPRHPLLKEKKVSQSDLSAKEVWLLNEGHCFRDQVISLCSDARKKKPTSGNLRFESGNLETLKKMVDQGGGYTLLPQLAALDIEDAEKKRRIRAFDSPVPTREVSLVHHRGFAKQATAQALMVEIQESLPPEILRLKAGAFRRVDMKPFS